MTQFPFRELTELVRQVQLNHLQVETLACLTFSRQVPFTMVATASMDGPCEITVDTGYNISIVRPDILSSVSQDLTRSMNSCLRTVTGERDLPSNGRDSCNFALAPWWSLRNCGLLTYMMSVFLVLTFCRLMGAS